MKIKITEFSEEEQPGQQPAGKRYMIERIVGPGAKGHPELVGAPHRHTLEESDRVKRNSIQRAMMQKVKGTPRAVVSWIFCSSSKWWFEEEGGSCRVDIRLG